MEENKAEEEPRPTQNFGQARISMMPKEAPKHKFTHGTWSEKEAAAGFSKELVSCDFEKIKDLTDIDTLEAYPYQTADKAGVTTLYQAFKRNLFRKPNANLYGTRVGDKYEWQTLRSIADKAEHLSYGINVIELAPEVQADGKAWRFIGIWSKSSAECNIVHVANMHQSITSVVIQDEATAKHIIEQTELTTVAVSSEYLPVIAELKKGDSDGKMKSLTTVFCFESAFSEEGK